jgi:peroxiredoxin Q/BCP
MLQPGDKPADFTLPDQDGTPVQWSALRGRPVVVFFYPKADTPGCTKEACAFRDLAAEFEALGVTVLGASADKPAKQGRFKEKYDLSMPLLADEARVILDPWGVWGPKQMYGKTYEGISRTTFLFDADGAVVRVWEKVKVAGHADEVLAAARALLG